MPQMKSKGETLEGSLKTGQFEQTIMVSSLLEPVTSSVCGRLAAGLSINGRFLCRSFIFLSSQADCEHRSKVTVSGVWSHPFLQQSFRGQIPS